jgi:hypothetical protein
MFCLRGGPSEWFWCVVGVSLVVFLLLSLVVVFSFPLIKIRQSSCRHFEKKHATIHMVILLVLSFFLITASASGDRSETESITFLYLAAGSCCRCHLHAPVARPYVSIIHAMRDASELTPQAKIFEALAVSPIRAWARVTRQAIKQLAIYPLCLTGSDGKQVNAYSLGESPIRHETYN